MISKKNIPLDQWEKQAVQEAIDEEYLALGYLPSIITCPKCGNLTYEIGNPVDVSGVYEVEVICSCGYRDFIRT